MTNEADQGRLFVALPRIVLPEVPETGAVGLLSIKNGTNATEQLADIRGTNARLMHYVAVGDEMHMIPVDRLAIPRNSTLEFEAEALHLVFDLGPEVAAGDLVQATFVFENAGEMDVVFVVGNENDTD